MNPTLNEDRGLPRSKSPYDYHVIRDRNYISSRLPRSQSPYDYHVVRDSDRTFGLPVRSISSQIAVKQQMAPTTSYGESKMTQNVEVIDENSVHLPSQQIPTLNIPVRVLFTTLPHVCY